MIRLTTKITVLPLDLTSLRLDVEVLGVYALALTPGGTYVLDSDGVGTGPLAAEDSFTFHGVEASLGSITPNVQIPLTVQEMHRLTGSPVNLADFIRSGTARLDRNYEEMRRVLQYALYD